jgi:serine/threonine protein kinase
MSGEKDQGEGTVGIGSPDPPTIPAVHVEVDPYIGKTLKDRYLITRELGRGGIGIVYLANDKQLLSRPVVIKVLLEESGKNEWFKKKFDQEIEALARIEHPGVVGVLDAGQMPDGKPYLVMQFVEGNNLRSAMTGEGMEFDRAAQILRQIGQALNAAHDKRVYHRDLKPENIMLQCLSECEQQVKLIDFGIAKVIDSKVASDNETTTVAGTIAYMAPEQLLGKPAAASDIYALGVIAYEMLCGRRPFNPNSPYELLEMQRAGVKDRPTDLRNGLPKPAETAILKALAFNSDERYGRARDFGEEIAISLTARAEQKIRNELEPVPRPVAAPGAHEPSPGWRLSSRAVISALALLIALVAGVVIWQLSISKPVISINQVEAKDDSPDYTGPIRKISYSITLLRDPAIFAGSKPQRLPRETLFSKGDRIRLDMFSPQDGWLYILNERPITEDGISRFNLLFPFPPTGQKSAEVPANQPVLVPGEGWFILDNEKGAEKVWVIYSASKVPELEILTKWVNERDRGEIKSVDETRAIRDFLSKNSRVKHEVEKDEALTQTNIKASGDVLAHLITLAHRSQD